MSSEYKNLIERVEELEELEKGKVNKCKIINSIDANTINDTQINYCNECTNLPRNNTNGYLITIKYTDSYLVQKFIRRADKKEYMRFKENNVWTSWQRVGDIEITTGTEYLTGRVIDGKREYAKMIDCGNLPNAGVKSIQTGIPSLSAIKLIKMEGITSNGYPLPFIAIPSLATYSIQMYCYGSGIEIKTATDYSNQTATVTLYYTKNNE